MEPWFLDNLVCPIDKSPLVARGERLVSTAGREYPVIEGVPVMLVQGVEQTLGVASASLAATDGWDGEGSGPAGLYLESLGLSPSERSAVLEAWRSGAGGIDPVVAQLVAATNGQAYRHLIGRLKEYPIPDIPLAPSEGASLLDLGCSWGRWSVAAGRKGYEVVGLDPSLGAVMAARRVAAQLGVPSRYVVGDARFLPFRAGRFDTVFSYSVLQHFSKTDARTTLREVGRVLAAGGRALVQMPNRLGVRCLYHQARRGFRKGREFEVRYWSLAELERTFGEEVGPSVISVDCFFGLGLQRSDKHLMPRGLQLAIEASEKLKTVSARVRGLRHFADSVLVQAAKL